MRASVPTVEGNVLARSTIPCVFDADILIDEESVRIWIGSNSRRGSVPAHLAPRLA